MFNSKKLLASLLAFFLWATPAFAQGWLPLAEASVTPVSNACTTSSGTTITFTAQGTGGANPNRISVVSINWDDSTNAGTASITAVTIGGLSMIKAASALNGAQNSNSEIWYVSNPSGTSADIVITAATAINGVTIEVYSLIGFVTNPVSSSIGTTSVSQGYNNKQVALAAGSRQINVSTSLSNMVNDFSSACGPSLWGVHASQRLNGTNQTLTSTISPTSNTPLIALAVWSSGTGGPPCTESTTFLARTSGLDAIHQNAYTSLICGLVTDGIYSKFDMLHIYATQNSTTALLNLVSTSYNGTAFGSPAFQADRGFTGVDSSTTVYINTVFIPSSAPTPKYVQNSGHISSWVVGGISALAMMGCNNAGITAAFLNPLNAGNSYYLVNQSGLTGVAAGSATGHQLGNRTVSTTIEGYRNGSSVLSTASTSTAPPPFAIYTLGNNISGTVTGAAYQLAMASIGSGFTASDVANFYNRLRTYMTAVGVP